MTWRQQWHFRKWRTTRGQCPGRTRSTRFMSWCDKVSWQSQEALYRARLRLLTRCHLVLFCGKLCNLQVIFETVANKGFFDNIAPLISPSLWFSPRRDKYIASHSDRRLYMSYSSMICRFGVIQQQHLPDISLPDGFKRLKSFGFVSEKPIEKPYRNARHQHLRLQFAKGFLERPVSLRQSIYFADESLLKNSYKRNSKG